MSATLRGARARHLDELHRYAARGVFPRNLTHAQRVPIFIDDEGNACAVGHLMIASGAGPTAAAIASSQNTARVPEIRVAAASEWIAASGLSVAEHTRIQPNYCPCEEMYMPVCGDDGTTYANACTATECAGVEIAHEGVCDTDTEGNATDWPAPGTSTDTGEATSTSSGGETSGTTTSTTESAATTTSTSESSGGGDETNASGATRSGCRVAPDASYGWAAWWLVPLSLRRWRARR